MGLSSITTLPLQPVFQSATYLPLRLYFIRNKIYLRTYSFAYVSIQHIYNWIGARRKNHKNCKREKHQSLAL